ncbi:hypothetical protein [Methanosarcina sp.]|uniref:hypothetical protein n=1 Tax=Methanosarcina sp. TaxID=2213 RepID=UPI002B777C6E|nr:hypothetical protein [Methanosarcina sp.]HOW13515.1 hypothetical protein [Methanosarcina sp.]
MANICMITTNLRDDYLPLVDCIDAIAIQKNTSRAGVIRDILCEYFEFEPEKKTRPYSTMKNSMVEC